METNLKVTFLENLCQTYHHGIGIFQEMLQAARTQMASSSNTAITSEDQQRINYFESLLGAIEQNISSWHSIYQQSSPQPPLSGYYDTMMPTETRQMGSSYPFQTEQVYSVNPFSVISQIASPYSLNCSVGQQTETQQESISIPILYEDFPNLQQLPVDNNGPCYYVSSDGNSSGIPSTSETVELSNSVALNEISNIAHFPPSVDSEMVQLFIETGDSRLIQPNDPLVSILGGEREPLYSMAPSQFFPSNGNSTPRSLLNEALTATSIHSQQEEILGFSQDVGIANIIQ